jgi:hypothetical protein
MGLLVAFTFAGASARLDVRRQLIVEETNAIGTAYLRLDLLRAEARSTLQDHFASTWRRGSGCIGRCQILRRHERNWLE